MSKYFVKTENGWNHRTPLKLVVNPVLRKVQFWTDRPHVIASNTRYFAGEPIFMGYTMARIKYEKSRNKLIGAFICFIKRSHLYVIDTESASSITSSTHAIEFMQCKRCDAKKWLLSGGKIRMGGTANESK